MNKTALLNYSFSTCFFFLSSLSAALPGREAVMHPKSPLDAPWQENDRIGAWRKKTFSEIYPGEKKSTDDFAAQIRLAASNKQKEVRIAPGIYHTGRPAFGAHVILSNLNDLVIHAEGVVLLGHTPTTMLILKQCARVTLRGLVIDYSPEGFPFTQGTVILKDGAAITVQIHDGYPVPDASVKTIRKVGCVDPLTLLLKRDLDTTYSAAYSVKDRMVTIQNIRGDYAVGDIAVLTCRQGSPHGLMMEECESVTIEEVVIHTAPMFSILDARSAKSIYRRVSITPGPIPDGAKHLRARSGAQDGIHITSMRGGTLVEDCLVECHDDDGVAASAPYLPVFDVMGSTVIVGGKKGAKTTYLSVNEMVRCTRRSDMTIYGLKKVKALEQIRDAALISNLDAKSAGLNWGKTADTLLQKGFYWKVELENAEGLSAGDLLSPTLGNSGLIVRGNTIRNHRARSILIKSSDLLIENNLIEHGQIAGLVLSPEAVWLESDFTWNARIKNNIFHGCGYIPSNPATTIPAVVNVIAPGTSGPAPAGQHRNLVFEGNTLERSYTLPFMITSAKSVVITNNRILHSHFQEKVSGSNWGVQQSAFVNLKNCDGVVISKNTISQTGSFYKQPIFFDGSVTNLSAKAEAFTRQ